MFFSAYNTDANDYVSDDFWECGSPKKGKASSVELLQKLCNFPYPTLSQANYAGVFLAFLVSFYL